MNPLRNSREIGENEENRALRFFKEMGWKLLKRNYHCRWGEIDLIFDDCKETVIFVEVKFRSSSEFGPAQSAVHYKKQERLIKTALHFVKRYHLDGSNFRFDIAAITPEGIEHIPNAFSAFGYTI